MDYKFVGYFVQDCLVGAEEPIIKVSAINTPRDKRPHTQVSPREIKKFASEPKFATMSQSQRPVIV